MIHTILLYAILTLWVSCSLAIWILLGQELQKVEKRPFWDAVGTSFYWFFAGLMGPFSWERWRIYVWLGIWK